MRALSPVEAALVFAIVGSVLAVSLPAFVRNVHASRLAEPIDGLEKLTLRAAALADGMPQMRAYPDSVPLSPAQVPRGELVTDPPGTWSHPTWRLLAFGFTTPHAYSFELTSNNGPDVSTFRAVARGDLDGDGVLSTFSVSGEIKPTSPPKTFPLEVAREVE